MTNTHTPLSVGILGSGRIGLDLLYKVKKSKLLDCHCFIGRNPDSSGLKHASELRVRVSSQSIDEIIKNPTDFDLIFDATSAHQHRHHAPILESLGILSIDLTPARVGLYCIPAINVESSRYAKNINMVTCGGQVSAPIVDALSKVVEDIRSIKVSTTVAHDSLGPATFENIDDYYQCTAEVLSLHGKTQDVSVQLDTYPEDKPKNMLTNIQLSYSGYINQQELKTCIEQRIFAIQKYAPGYQTLKHIDVTQNTINLSLEMIGEGDYLPRYAGNLDIINCAAINVAEFYALKLINIQNQVHNTPLMPNHLPLLA